MYKLWEGSWEDDAVVRDRRNRIYTRPEKVHRVVHNGSNYRVDAIHLSEPSPQRTHQLLVVSLLPSTLNVYFSWDRRSKSLRREWPISDSAPRSMAAIQRSFLYSR
jgi:hypothetical protein